MPTKRLPVNPSIGHLKSQAKNLLKHRRAEIAAAYQRIREFHPQLNGAADSVIQSAPFTLSDAQLVIAREYGFASWVRLRAAVERLDLRQLDQPHHERIDDTVFRRAVDLLDEGNIRDLRAYLARYPEPVRQRVRFEGGNYFSNPTLLEFIAENPVRHGHIPDNVVGVAEVILDAGGRLDQDSIDSTLALVCSGRVARELGVQIPLIDKLCDYGAAPDNAMPSALGHGEFDAVEALIRRGAAVDLAVAAATGRTDAARRALATADDATRHRALALAARHGKANIVGLLLDAGEDPNRYNPVGCHAHSTPLHQAALAGHIDVIQTLVERGARLDICDIHHHATPLDWATHTGHAEIVEYLRRQR